MGVARIRIPCLGAAPAVHRTPFNSISSTYVRLRTPNIPVFIGGDTAVCSPLYGGEDFSPVKVRRFGRPDVVARQMHDTSRYTPAVKLTLQMIALAALVIVLARPRAGAKEEQETSAGIEVMIAFDVSNSMLASSTDRPDGVPRLDRARLLLEKLVDRLDNDKGRSCDFCRTVEDAASADV